MVRYMPPSRKEPLNTEGWGILSRTHPVESLDRPYDAHSQASFTCLSGRPICHFFKKAFSGIFVSVGSTVFSRRDAEMVLEGFRETALPGETQIGSYGAERSRRMRHQRMRTVHAPLVDVFLWSGTLDGLKGVYEFARAHAADGTQLARSDGSIKVVLDIVAYLIEGLVVGGCFCPDAIIRPSQIHIDKDGCCFHYLASVIRMRRDRAWRESVKLVKEGFQTEAFTCIIERSYAACKKEWVTMACKAERTDRLRRQSDEYRAEPSFGIHGVGSAMRNAAVGEKRSPCRAAIAEISRCDICIERPEAEQVCGIAHDDIGRRPNVKAYDRACFIRRKASVCSDAFIRGELKALVCRLGGHRFECKVEQDRSPLLDTCSE